MLLLKELGTAIELAASAPRGPMELHVSLARGDKSETIAFDLRGGPALGASHVKSIAAP
jgi:hypothetical protein